MNSRFYTRYDRTILVPVMMALFALGCMILSAILPGSTDPHVTEGMASFGMVTGVIAVIWLAVVLVSLSCRLVSVFVDEELIVNQWMLFREQHDWSRLTRIYIDGKVARVRSASAELMQIDLSKFDEVTAGELVNKLHRAATLHGVKFFFGS